MAGAIVDVVVLGTGSVGSALGTGLLRAGHNVIYGSRNPDGKANYIAPVLSFRDAVAAANVVFNALPGASAPGTLDEIGADALAGKVLVDVANAVDEKFQLVYPNGSLGATLQAAYPRTSVVKTLNTVSAAVMSNPGAIAPATVFLSGNDAASKSLVSGLLVDLGWNTDAQLDLGDISTARATEHYIFLSFGILTALNTTSYGIRVVT
jgi:8-hydroxy-5-deazaflavin:NADPH oxidoreductase